MASTLGFATPQRLLLLVSTLLFPFLLERIVDMYQKIHPNSKTNPNSNKTYTPQTFDHDIHRPIPTTPTNSPIQSPTLSPIPPTTSEDTAKGNPTYLDRKTHVFAVRSYGKFVFFDEYPNFR